MVAHGMGMPVQLRKQLLCAGLHVVVQRFAVLRDCLVRLGNAEDVRHTQAAKLAEHASQVHCRTHATEDAHRVTADSARLVRVAASAEIVHHIGECRRNTVVVFGRDDQEAVGVADLLLHRLEHFWLGVGIPVEERRLLQQRKIQLFRVCTGRQKETCFIFTRSLLTFQKIEQ